MIYPQKTVTQQICPTCTELVTVHGTTTSSLPKDDLKPLVDKALLIKKKILKIIEEYESFINVLRQPGVKQDNSGATTVPFELNNIEGSKGGQLQS